MELWRGGWVLSALKPQKVLAGGPYGPSPAKTTSVKLHFLVCLIRTHQKPGEGLQFVKKTYY